MYSALIQAECKVGICTLHEPLSKASMHIIVMSTRAVEHNKAAFRTFPLLYNVEKGYSSKTSENANIMPGVIKFWGPR